TRSDVTDSAAPGVDRRRRRARTESGASCGRAGRVRQRGPGTSRAKTGVKAGSNSGIEVIGLEDSFDGLIEPNRSRVLTPRNVTGILRLGGTILGTTNRGNPFAYPVATSEGVHDYSDRVVEMFHKMGLDALVVIGGDGTLGIAHEFCKRGVPVV